MEITDYKIQIENFYGPMDLLLYLLREDELTITDIPISRITEQFIAYVEMLKKLDIALTSDFMATAALLIEMKAKELLPKDELSEEDETVKIEFVRKLLEYKKFKELAKYMSQLIDNHSLRFPRSYFELPQDISKNEQVVEIDLWKVCKAYADITKEISIDFPVNILYSDIPLEKVMNELVSLLKQKGRILFSNFVQNKDKNYIITSFLAALELTKQEVIHVEQEKDFSELELVYTNKGNNFSIN